MDDGINTVPLDVILCPAKTMDDNDEIDDALMIAILASMLENDTDE